MHILGLSSAIESVTSSIATTKLPNQQFSHLIFDGVTGFAEYALINDKPFATESNADQHQALKWINRGDEKAFATYVYKYIKSFLTAGIQLTIVNCVSERTGGVQNVNYSFKKNLTKLKYSKLFYREGDASHADPNKNKVKLLPTFHLLVVQQVLTALKSEFPQLLNLIQTPVEPHFVSDLAQHCGFEKTLVVTNNADFYMSEKNQLQLCRFYDLSVSISANSTESAAAAEISVKPTSASDALVLLMRKWNLESLFELYLTMSLMKNDYTEDADVRKFVGNDMFNFEKIAGRVREHIDLLKEDETITEAQISDAVIEKAYKDNAAAIENSKKAFNALISTKTQTAGSVDENQVAASLVPSYTDKANTSSFVEHLKNGDSESLVHLLQSLRVTESVDALSCSTDTFSPEELWFPVNAKQVEYALLSNASPYKIDASFEEEKSFEAVNGGKIDKDLVEVKIAQQEKGTYLNPGNERVHAFKRNYTAYEVSDKAKSFIKLWVPEDSQQTVEEFENALKTVPAAYQPYVLVLNSLYHLLCARDPKPKVDFVFLNEIVFASLFLDQPLSDVKEVSAKLGTSGKIYNEEMNKLNQFVNANYYRFHSYVESGLLSYFNFSNAMGWFGDAFNNFASALLVNGTYAAYLRTLFNEEPTVETLINAIPEANRAAYTATKAAIKSLADKEVSQHFWLDDAEESLNSKTIYASNIPFDMKASDFYRIFDGIALKKVYLKSSMSGSGHSGRGTLEFEDEENMKRALVLFNRLKFGDRYLHLTPSAAKSSVVATATTTVETEEPKVLPSYSSQTVIESADGQWTRQNAIVRGGKKAKGRARAGIPLTTSTPTSAPAAEEKKGKSTNAARGRARNTNTGELFVDNKWGALLDDAE